MLAALTHWPRGRWKLINERRFPQVEYAKFSTWVHTFRAMSYRVMYRVTSWNNKKIVFSWQVSAAGNATLAGVRLLNMFISAKSHDTLNLVLRARTRVWAVHHASSVGLFAPRSSPGWRTGKTCPNFALWPLYCVFAMTSRTTTWCKTSEIGHVNPRSRVPLYISLRHACAIVTSSLKRTISICCKPVKNAGSI